METENTVGKLNLDAFSARVREIRERKGFSLARLGQQVGCSAPKLYKLEHGNFKTLSMHFVKQLCSVLCNEAEAAELFQLAGFVVPAASDINRIIATVEDTLRLPEFASCADELIAEVVGCVSAWRTSRRARNRALRKVIIPAGGWQARLLSLPRFERTLLPIVDEANCAKFEEILLVTPPNMPVLRELESTFPACKMTYIVQQQQAGLGNAILCAKQYVESEPFAILLPDEIDERRTALRDMASAYEDVRRPLVAVDTQHPEADIAVLRYYGFAKLGSAVTTNVFGLTAELVEKPKKVPADIAFRIAGRYILTPEIFAALQTNEHVENGPVKHDLTTAINRLWRTPTSVVAFRLNHGLLSIAPYRAIVEMMDNHPQNLFDVARYK